MPGLFAVEMGKGGVALVLLHGFASSHDYWKPVMDRLPANEHVGGRSILAFDLPGHGRSSPTETARTAEMADLLLEEFDRRGIAVVHLAGHSMGGAVACLVALKQPARIASLTLLAPGGFGPGINARLIRRYAVAQDETSLTPLLAQFYGSARAVPEEAMSAVLADRARPGAGEEYLRIAETFLSGEDQGVLPLDTLAGLGIPITVIWGEDDVVTPTTQAHRLPSAMQLHLYDGVGHSIGDEIPDEVVRLIGENVR